MAQLIAKPRPQPAHHEGKCPETRLDISRNANITAAAEAAAQSRIVRRAHNGARAAGPRKIRSSPATCAMSTNTSTIRSGRYRDPKKKATFSIVAQPRSDDGTSIAQHPEPEWARARAGWGPGLQRRSLGVFNQRAACFFS